MSYGEAIKSKAKKSKYGKFDEYEIKDAARTIQEAEKIKADPEKMKYVKMCMKKDLEASKKAYKSLDDIKEEYNEMEEED